MASFAQTRVMNSTAGCMCAGCSAHSTSAHRQLSVGRAFAMAPKPTGSQPAKARAALKAVARKEEKKTALRAATAEATTVQEGDYLAKRQAEVRKFFPTAFHVDDFMHRLEIALYAYGFTGGNTIACTNLCRDEITITVKNKIDSVFGSSFNTNGLGGVLTCGVTGLKAGLSHSPLCDEGKERYVFFSAPHIAIDSEDKVGAISRPGRPGQSCACGALAASLGVIKANGLDASCKKPGVHDYNDPELSILQQRLARRMRYEGFTEERVQETDLVGLTKVAERTICDDLEYLIENAVDTKKADYAVVSGLQVHNWATEFDNEVPNLEFVAPVEVYVVVNGKQTYIDLESVPSLTPRQMSMMATMRGGRPSSPDEHVSPPRLGGSDSL